MKIEKITLRKFVETCPLKSETIETGNIPINFKELSYVQKYIICEYGCTNIRRVLKVEKDFIFFAEARITCERIGNRIFKKSCGFRSFVRIGTNSIKTCGESRLVIEFLQKLNINWYVDIPENIFNAFVNRPSILRGILTHRIFSEETFYKAIGLYCLKTNKISWRNIRLYYTKIWDWTIPIMDLVCFSKDVNKSIQVFGTHMQDLAFYGDILKYAVKRNQIVDFTWSFNRLRQFHTEQILAEKEGVLEEKSTVPIYSNTVNGEHIKMLNTEREIFLEGTIMHHCLYRCYFDQIKKHQYIAWHMTIPEECTFSVRKGFAGLDQIYLSYDRMVQDSTRKLAEDFIREHTKKIECCFDEVSEAILPNAPIDLLVNPFDDLNF